jgi:hypothetical protein
MDCFTGERRDEIKVKGMKESERRMEIRNKWFSVEFHRVFSASANEHLSVDLVAKNSRQN